MAGLLTGSAAYAEAAERPNLIVIMADDLGYADVGFNGCEDVPTPHIDSIAEQGIQFTNGYVAYAGAMNPSQRNLLYNKEGLPASPFRTDDWPIFNPSDEIVTVNKPQKPDGYQSADWERPAMLQ